MATGIDLADYDAAWFGEWFATDGIQRFERNNDSTTLWFRCSEKACDTFLQHVQITIEKHIKKTKPRRQPYIVGQYTDYEGGQFFIGFTYSVVQSKKWKEMIENKE